MTTQQPEILSTTNAEAESQRVAIFEEYANGGLAQLQDELRGAVDYSERLLLTINAARKAENEPELASDGSVEFDLSRFL
jgi:dnd system-associated protein 4